MYLIDTNIFLEIFLNQNKAKDCEDFLKKVSDGEIDCAVSLFTVHAVEGILSDNLEMIEKFLRNISNSIGLLIYATSLDEELEVKILAEETKLDFDDGIQYFVAKKLGVDAIVSFDRHFDKVDIKRKEPEKILNELVEETNSENDLAK